VRVDVIGDRCHRGPTAFEAEPAQRFEPEL
jgi:hypothetical protein